MPGNEPTSEQLHIVVGLSAGMGDSQGNIKEPTPTDKLKEALSSKEAFKKHYLVNLFGLYICNVQLILIMAFYILAVTFRKCSFYQINIVGMFNHAGLIKMIFFILKPFNI
jgi:hypothetical protein